MNETRPTVPPELEDVVNQVGEFIEYWGFKNIHGRIWVHIFLAEEFLDASELIERLGVSKALISMSIADLIEYDVIHVAGKTARGTVTYASNPNLLNVIMNVLRKRERRMLARFSAATRLLKSLPKSHPDRSIPVDAARVETLAEMAQTAESLLDAMLQLKPMNFATLTGFGEPPVTAPDKKP